MFYLFYSIASKEDFVGYGFSWYVFFRLTRYKNFKEGHKRILVATDLVGRGIDIERVNIVINYDMPDSADTYLHRVCYVCRDAFPSYFCHWIAIDPILKIFILWAFNSWQVGRAGRFGTKGLAITFVSSASDSDVLNQVCKPSLFWWGYSFLVIFYLVGLLVLIRDLQPWFQVQERFEVDIKELPEQIDTSTYSMAPSCSCII